MERDPFEQTSIVTAENSEAVRERKRLQAVLDNQKYLRVISDGDYDRKRSWEDRIC